MSDPAGLIVVDVQRDFCEGGSLAVQGGAAVAAAVTTALAAASRRWAFVAASQDHHIDPGDHFAPPGTEPDYATTWPAHCVAGTTGAQLHPALVLPAGTPRFTKGEHRAAYSAFEGRDPSGRSLSDALRAAGVERVEVAGIATSYCVRASALDARRLGLPPCSSICAPTSTRPPRRPPWPSCGRPASRSAPGPEPGSELWPGRSARGS